MLPHTGSFQLCSFYQLDTSLDQAADMPILCAPATLLQDRGVASQGLRAILKAQVATARGRLRLTHEFSSDANQGERTFACTMH